MLHAAKSKEFKFFSKLILCILTLLFVSEGGVFAQNLRIDVNATTITPGPSEVLTYKIRYRCASITDHCYNAHITFTLPDALEIVSEPGVGGNVASVNTVGNMLDISLVSPPSAGGPTGALVAGAAGIIETRVRFKCGVNGVDGYPAVGTTVNFTTAPTFSATGESPAVADILNTNITVPVAATCPPEPPLITPPNNITKSTNNVRYNYQQGDTHSSAYYNISIPPFDTTATTSFYVEDDWPEGLWLNAQRVGLGGAAWEIQAEADGIWYQLSTFNGNWGSGLSIGDQLSDDLGNPIPGVYYESNAAGYRFVSGIDKFRLNISPPYPYAGSGNIFLNFMVAPNAEIGSRSNCITSNHPDWATACGHDIYIMDKSLMSLFPIMDLPYAGLGKGSLGNVFSEGWNLYTLSSNPQLYKDPLDGVFRLGVHMKNAEGGVTIESLLWDGFEFQTALDKPNFWFVTPHASGASTACLNPSSFTQIPNYEGSGRTLLRWEFPECLGDNYFYIVYSARYDLEEGPIPSSICHNGILKQYNGEEFGVYEYAAPDGECLTEYSSSANSGNGPCSGRPTVGGDMNSIKWVQGVYDAAQSRYPDSGETDLSGNGVYEIYIQSSSFEDVKQLDVVDVLPHLGDVGLLTGASRESEWSAELSSAITIERYKTGTGLIDVSGELPFGVQYTTSTNPCYLDAADEVNADIALANVGSMPACTDFSNATPGIGARGFLFRWFNEADPLVFGEYLKVTVNIRQLTGEPDNLTRGVSWNSVAFSTTQMDDDIIPSTEPLKVGLVMIDETTTAAIGDYVWLDANNNGRQDAGETPIAGVQVSLYDAAENPVVSGGLPLTTTTNADGYYCFLGLQPNTDYYVRLDNDADYASGGRLSPYMLTTTDAVGVNDELDSDAVLGTLTGSSATPRPQIYSPTGGAETETKTYDFGFFCPGSISGTAWMDSDNGGDKDGNEMALSGISVSLHDAVTDAVISGPTSTDASGNFSFTGVSPGTYYLSFSAFPFGKIPTYKDLTGNDNNDSDVGSTGRTDVFALNTCDIVDLDFGMRDIPANPASICGTSWDDLLKDGVKAGEPGVAEVVVQLLDMNGFILDNTKTDASGVYCFQNLEPNQAYRVAFIPTLPQGMFSVAGTDQDVDLLTGETMVSYTPGPDEVIENVDAGFMGVYSIGNQVWNDVNNNGLFEAGEPVFANVAVRLLDMDGSTELATTITDENGRYLFSNLMAGTYYVAAGVPEGGYQSSTDIATTNTPNATDSDDNGISEASSGEVLSDMIVLTPTAGSPGDANWTEVDAGVRIQGKSDPASNPKAYYTVDFGFFIPPPCPDIMSMSSSTANICLGDNIDLNIMHEADPGDLAIYSSTNPSLSAAVLYDFTNHGANGISAVNTSISPLPGATLTTENGVTPTLAGNVTFYIILAQGNVNIMDPLCLPFASTTVTVNAVPDLSVPSPITNSCPSTTVDLTDVSVTGLADGNSTVGTISYHTVSNPVNSTDQVVATPTMAATGATYYIRKETAANCVDIVPIVVNSVNCACPAPPSVIITEENVTTCAAVAATFNYSVENGPTTTFSHNGSGVLSITQLPNGTGTFTYSPTATDEGNVVLITATIADPDGTGPCASAVDTATVTVSSSSRNCFGVQIQINQN